MAELIPSLNSCLARMQAGEKRFARRLVSLLEDDYLCWYDLPLGTRRQYSDFIVLHPNRGLLLLEVKDWKLETIQSIDHASAQIITSNGLKSVANPLAQVRQCGHQIVNRLQQDKQLVQLSGRHQGKLAFPYGFGVVLSNITRSQYESTNMREVLPPHLTICKDEMVESVYAELFQQRLWNMFSYQFNNPLTLPQIERIRWHLFPEVRINVSEQASLFPEIGDEADIEGMMPDLIEVMDKQQEQLARNLGDGHRVIHGVAGSGKTLILCYRCAALANFLQKPILVLCFNILLAARLREMIAERGLEGKVSVHHFHEWCGEQLRLYNIRKPAPGEDYSTRLVDTVIDAVEEGSIPRGQYGALMIDEGHDFEAEWLQLVVGMVDPDTNNFLLLYDDAQSIYAKRSSLDFSLKSVGVNAIGRTTILKLNYRNTAEVLGFAQRFARQYMNLGDEDSKSLPLIQPEAVGKRGPDPVVKSFDSYEREASYIAHIFKQLHELRSAPWSSMCITYRTRSMGRVLQRALAEASIPCEWLDTQAQKKVMKIGSDTVKLMTMHGSKGLEFPIVAVSGVGVMPMKNADPVAEAKLLYVAMTRSTDKLLITADNDSEFVAALNNDGEGQQQVQAS